MFNRIAIIGLGLIGGSIGLALRQAKAAQQVAGFDLGKGVSERAHKVGAIDQAYTRTKFHSQVVGPALRLWIIGTKTEGIRSSNGNIGQPRTRCLL